MAAGNDDHSHRRNHNVQYSSNTASGASGASHPVSEPNSQQNTLHHCSATPAPDERAQQQRNVSLPPHIITEGLPAQRVPHPDMSAPTFASAPSTPEHRQVKNPVRPVERATDPRKRPCTRSPSLHSAVPATADAPPSMAKSSSNVPEPVTTASSLNSAPEADSQMADEVGPSPIDLMANLFIALSDASFAAGLAKAQTSQAKEEMDVALKEYNQVTEKTRNKPPILHFLETKKRAAEQGYNQSSEKLASASQLRDSVARELATSVLNHFQECSTHQSKSFVQESSLKPLIERLDKLESIQAEPPPKQDDGILTSLESRVSSFEASTVSNRAQVMQKIASFRDQDQKLIDSLQGQIKDLSGQLDSLSSRILGVQELDRFSDLEQGLRNLQKSDCQSELKGQIAQLEADMTELKDKVAEMHAQKEASGDPLAVSPMFLEYVKLYQKDRAEDLRKLNTIAEASSATNQKLAEYETKTTSSLQDVNAKLMAWEVRDAWFQQSIASIKEEQDQNRQNKLAPTQLETELQNTAASHRRELQHLRSYVDGLAQTERKDIDDVSTSIQKLDAFAHSLHENLSKQVAATEHSIKALTARYNNLSSEQLAKRMAHHINQFPNTLQMEQNELKSRLDFLETQHKSQKVELDEIKSRIGDGALDSSSDDTSRKNFENRIKTEYYDVLESKVREYRDDFRDSIESLQSAQGLIKDAQEALLQRVNELEADTLLRSFKRTTNQKASPKPEIPPQSLSKPPDLPPGSPGHDNAIDDPETQYRSNQVGDSIAVRPVAPFSQCRRPK